MRGQLGLGNRSLMERMRQKAVIQTSDLATHGRLNPEQSDRFIDYVIDQVALFRDGITVRRMNADRAHLDKIAIGTRVLRKGVEYTAPGDLVGVTTSKRELAVTEMILPVDVTFSFVEDNIERDNFEDHLARMITTQLGNDLEDLAINGDTALVGDDFLKIENGWLKILKDAADKRYDTNGGDDFRNVVFKQMLAAMPVKFKANKPALRYYVSVNNEEKYRFQIGQRQTVAGDNTLLLGGPRLPYDGIPVVGVPFMPDDVHLLTMPQNLVFGIRRLVTLGIFRHERKRAWEYTWTLRADFEVLETSATVIAYDF